MEKKNYERLSDSLITRLINAETIEEIRAVSAKLVLLSQAQKMSKKGSNLEEDLKNYLKYNPSAFTADTPEKATKLFLEIAGASDTDIETRALYSDLLNKIKEHLGIYYDSWKLAKLFVATNDLLCCIYSLNEEANALQKLIQKIEDPEKRRSLVVMARILLLSDYDEITFLKLFLPGEKIKII